jgi:SRSO17 transposase
MDVAGEWQQEFQEWLQPFLDALGHKARRKWAPLYMLGLLGPLERKSIQPMAQQIAPSQGEQLHHFVATSGWETAPLETELARKAQHLVGGPQAYLIVDDTTLPKKGRCSVGVAHQYSGALGKMTNCQTLVSLTLARQEVPVCIALRLFLPQEWTDDSARCAKAGIPPDRQRHRTKGQIAIEELDRVLSAGVRFGVVLADAGYGMSAEFRKALSARGLTWAVGIQRTQKVYPLTVTISPAPLPAQLRGRPPTHPVPNKGRRTVEHVLDALPRHQWRTVRWRRGTKGYLQARFAVVRVRVADGAELSYGQHLPGEEVWLVGERRSSGERKFYLTNHSAHTPARRIITAIKARWSCEQGHQQLKEELGLDHFEGRSWQGLHHHALLTMIALAFLQHLRLRAGGRRAPCRSLGPPLQPALPAVRRAVVAAFGQLSQRCCRCQTIGPAWDLAWSQPRRNYGSITNLKMAK